MKKPPKYNLVVSDRARKMLRVHIRFLAKVSSSGAKKVETALLGAMRSLVDMPGRYPFFQSEHVPPNKFHCMYVARWYLVLYQVKDDTVFVERIVDCREDYGWLL